VYTQYLEVKQSKTGSGVFATIEIPSNVPIIEMTGPIYVESEIPNQILSTVLQIGPNTFIGSSGLADDYINHSCNPNCMVHVIGNRAILYSMYVIPKGNELTFDYSTTSTDTLEKWKMDCQCGDYNCRKVISGHQYLEEKTKKEYQKKGMIPLFITNPNLFLKK
jgi:hypothetical protein